MTLARIAKIAKEEHEEAYSQGLPFPALAILAILARDSSFVFSFPSQRYACPLSLPPTSLNSNWKLRSRKSTAR
ncbi:MAG TPA: hypothetical protein VJS12_21265 [Steroidobacteraceae bacterium]|nr:hypothetical protein [Steroidobacteraceae bacterium]